MATPKDQNEKTEAPANGGMGQLIISLVIAVVFGAGGGAAFGFLAPLGAPPSATASAEPEHAETAAPAPASGRFPSDALEIPLDPILVDLASEQRTRVRLDLSIIAAHGTPQGSTLKSEVREDVIAFMKGLSLGDVAGIRGFQNLRQQLEDRAKIRGRGVILGLLIGGMAIE